MRDGDTQRDYGVATPSRHEPDAAPGDVSGYHACFIPKGMSALGAVVATTMAKRSVVSRQGLVAVTTWTVPLRVPEAREFGTSSSERCECNPTCGRGRAALVGSGAGEGSAGSRDVLVSVVVY